MSKYIDTDKFPTRDFVIDVLYDCGIRADISVEDIADEIFEMFSSNIPTADVRENTHGKWLRTPMACYGGGTITEFECYACGEHQICESNFCPNCGADMRAKDEM